MSLWISMPYDLYVLSVIALGVLSLVIAVSIYWAKSIVYSVYLLAFLGLTTAALISLLGFQVVGAIHVIVYVGAAVLFFIITVSMMGDIKSPPIWKWKSALIVVPMFVLFYYALGTVASGLVYQPAPTLVEGNTISRYMVEEFYPQVIIAVFAIGVSIVESIIIAMRELR